MGGGAVRIFKIQVLFAIALMAVAFAVPRVASAESEFPFPRPASLETNVQFWVDVFAQYSVRDFVVTDRDRVWRVYQVYHLDGEGQPTREEVEWVNSYLKEKYSAMLTRLAVSDPEGAEEQRIVHLFPNQGPDAYMAAAQNLRVQEGLREQFREGLRRSRYYWPTMEKIFRGAGLPPELITLAAVESGFQGHAKSGAGAVGIWQFTRATGKKYMKISRRRDDRLNTTRETQAAAKLLRYNYEVLGDWPLAITAYNYGTGGTARAAECSGNDYCKMIETYSGPHFGFAVKNYYAEFLAALQVHEYEDDYFPGIADEPMIKPSPIVRTSHRSSKSKASLKRVTSHPKHRKKSAQQKT